MDSFKEQMHKHEREVDKLKALWSLVKDREIKSLRREMQLNSLEKALKAQQIALNEKQAHLVAIDNELESKGEFLLQEEVRIDALRGHGKIT